jgi:chromosomal replication initiation ATPase DnaA
MLDAVVTVPAIPVQPTFREIAKAYACNRYDVTAAEFNSKSMARHLVMARTLFIWLVRTYRPHVSYTTLGNWINRDHSSAIYLFRKAEGLLERDEEFQQECARFPIFYAQRSGYSV